MIRLEDIGSTSKETSYGTFQSMSTKYNGLIELSASKKIRNLLFSLMQYNYSCITSGSTNLQTILAIVNVVMMWVRFIQLFGPAFYVSYVISGSDGFSLWNRNNAISRIIEYLSVLWNLIPPLNRVDFCPYILLVYSILFAVIFILLIFCSVYYKKYAKLPKFIPPFSILFTSTFGFVFHPVAVAHSFEIIGFYINNGIDHSNFIFNVITIVLFVAFLVIYFYFYIHIYAISIEFRDDSLLCVLFYPQVQIMAGTAVVTAISSFFTHFTTIYKCVGCFLNAAVYAFLFFNRYIEGGFIRKKANVIFSTVSLSGCLISILCGVLSIVEKQIETSFIFIIIGVTIVIAIVMNFVETHRRTKFLIILDEVEARNEIGYIKDFRSFMSLVIIGFEKAHFVCMNYQIFKDALEKWPENTRIWICFLKFLAIYAELGNETSLVTQQIQNAKLKGYLVKNMLHQSAILVKSRDVNLSPELKKKIGALSKRMQDNKHKMRNIWDLVIQSNLNEMEGAIENCYVAVESSFAEFDHVARQYSNNRFVARTYTRFCHEILADRHLTNEWMDKCRQLQKGVRITTDAAHDLGLEAFPLLPTSISSNKLSMNTSEFDMSASEGFNSELDDDSRNQQTSMQNMLLLNSIKNISIPSIRHSIIARLLLLFILFLVPVIAISIYMSILIDKLLSPLDFIYTLSYLRCIGFQVAIIGHHYVLEAIPEKLLEHVERTDRNPPESLGSSFDPRVQLLYLLKTGSSMVQSLSTFASFMEGNPTMDQAREVIFGSHMDYIFFKGRGDRTVLQLALQVGMMDVFNQLYSLLELQPITDENNIPEDPLNSSVLNTSKILNAVQNAETFGNFIYDSLDLVIKYLQDEDNIIQKVFLILMIALCALYIILQIIITFLCLKEIRKDKVTVYRCLTALPKNVVSSVVEYLRVLKKDKEDSLMKGTTNMTTDADIDLNKQEENILKILITGDSSGGVKSEVLIIILTVIHTIAFCAFIIFTGLSIMAQSKNLVSEAPHIDYLLGAYTYDAATVLAIDLMLGELNNLSTDFQVSTLITRFYQRLERSQNYYSKLMYGDTSTKVKINPFKAFAGGLQEAINRMSCNDISNKPPDTIYQAYKCIRPDVMLYIHHNMVLSIVTPVEKNNAIIDKNNKLLPEIYDLSLLLLYENFFFPIFNRAVQSLETKFHEAISPIIIVAFILFFVSLIIEIIIIIINLHTRNHIVFALKLLLHCPADSVASCSTVQRVLSGDFSTDSYEGVSKKKEFFDKLVRDLPKACVIVELSGEIRSPNVAACRMFKASEEELKGSDVKVLLGNSSPKEFKYLSNVTKPVEVKVEYTDKTGEKMNLVVEIRPEQSVIIASFSDVTQTVRYNTLISEEREKSDALLKSILPASLVQRVQKGEKEISFAVQSVSVMFTDIVEFTPWCGSNTGPFVMSTLNTLFKEFDKRMTKYSTMTKIKCIGDCYMAAGGIFSEVNQPAVHAGEAVEFGLDQIKAVGKVNTTLGTTLRVRVGVNTGGPIVAGVLGIGKPTFEILGPTINMAQQMEHHGVPMNVHISRSVYEMIYGGKFKVKERGNIEIKNGVAQTYLVTE